MLIYQISVFIENKQGRLGEIISTLSSKGVDIRALSVADTTDFGILRLVVDNPDLAMSILKAEGVTASKTQVVGVSLNDKPGALAEVLAILSEAQIAVEYVYAFITHRKNDGCVVLHVDDNEAAVKVLSAKGITLADKNQ